LNRLESEAHSLKPYPALDGSKGINEFNTPVVMADVSVDSPWSMNVTTRLIDAGSSQSIA
jgi:hypothetical protein